MFQIIDGTVCICPVCEGSGVFSPPTEDVSRVCIKCDGDGRLIVRLERANGGFYRKSEDARPAIDV